LEREVENPRDIGCVREGGVYTRELGVQFHIENDGNKGKYQDDLEILKAGQESNGIHTQFV
jgi:hypothetical protein